MSYPLIVVCRVTTACNLACGFCAYDRRLPFARTTLGNSQIERLIDLMADWHARQSTRQRLDARAPLLSWLGGEPLRWREWTRYSALARARGLAVSATSNATMLASAAVRAQVLECLDELTVSVDAVGARHDQLRGWPGGYRRTLAALHALADARAAGGQALRLRANIVLMRSTVEASTRSASTCWEDATVRTSMPASRCRRRHWIACCASCRHCGRSWRSGARR